MKLFALASVLLSVKTVYTCCKLQRILYIVSSTDYASANVVRRPDPLCFRPVRASVRPSVRPERCYTH